MFPIDAYAKEIALTRYALPPCVHVPVAARNECAIQKYVGNISLVLIGGRPNRALLVEPHETPAINNRLPIWRLKEAALLHWPKQVWVHVDYSGYRSAYIKAFPCEDLTGLVIDHVLNRRVARLKGFHYLRIVPISRAANSSSGGLSEKWAVEYHGTPEMVLRNSKSPAFIQYADLADIVKMLNIKTWGSLQDPVNEAQALVREE